MNLPLPAPGLVTRLALTTPSQSDAESVRPELALISTSNLACGGIDPFQTWLSDEELARAYRFVKSEDRISFMAAHALLRIELRRRFAHLPFPAVIETQTRGGKPRLVGVVHGVDFNISHTAGLVACVTAQGAYVGVDCESLSREVRVELAATSFSRAEQAWLRQQQEMPITQAFLHIWTLKEAVSKAAGLGLGVDFNSFTVLPLPVRMIDVGPYLQSTGNWSLWQSNRDGDFVVAVAACRRRTLHTGQQHRTAG